MNSKPELAVSDQDELAPSQDKVGRYQIAAWIAHHLVNSKEFVTFSINGPWGSGKTVLMRWVEKELKSTHSATVKTYWFDAWEYESLGNLTYPLIAMLESDTSTRKIRKAVKRVLDKVAPIASVGEASGISFLGAAKKAIDVTRDTLSTQTKSVQDLRSEVKLLVREVLGAGQEKVVFLVDNLDRCSPENVIKLLESIKNFLYLKGANQIVFVFAIDNRIIAQAIKSRYGNLFSEDDGYEYLEKVINFSYELPLDLATTSRAFVLDYKANFDVLKDLDAELAVNILERSRLRSLRILKKVLNRLVVVMERLKSKNPNAFVLFFVIFLYEACPQIYRLIRETRNYNLVEGILHWSPDRYEKRSREAWENQRLMTFVNDFQELRNIVDYIKGFRIGDKEIDLPSEMRKCMDLLTECGL